MNDDNDQQGGGYGLSDVRFPDRQVVNEKSRMPAVCAVRKLAETLIGLNGMVNDVKTLL